MKVYIDGEFYEKEHAKISVFDHGLLYGDGVFEGIRFYNGRVFRLEEHIDRLFDSARAICLNIPLDKAAVTAATIETIKRNELRDGYVRLVVTRGDAMASGGSAAAWAGRRSSGSSPGATWPPGGRRPSSGSTTFPNGSCPGTCWSRFSTTQMPMIVQVTTGRPAH